MSASLLVDKDVDKGWGGAGMGIVPNNRFNLLKKGGPKGKGSLTGGLAPPWGTKNKSLSWTRKETGKKPEGKKLIPLNNLNQPIEARALERRSSYSLMLQDR